LHKRKPGRVIYFVKTIKDIFLLQEISRHILAWYKKHQRDLPWRKTRDPYCIWISEIMLQQTQVETVIPYYHRFLSHFPTVQALAAASLDSVLKAWENMGYYARARHLHAAAKEIVCHFDGNIPGTWDELMNLPGIGNYTAGAILSIAFGKTYPAVDGNVKRVLSRVFTIETPINSSETKRNIGSLAQQLVPKKEAGLFNQGLMDIGANICKPQKPTCEYCPIQSLCLAYERQLQDILPIRERRGPIPHRRVTAGIIYNKKGQILIVQRPKKGLLGGLWKLPGGQQKSGENLNECLKNRVNEELRIRIQVGKRITSVKHAYSHFRITLYTFQCIQQSGKPKAAGCADWKWTAMRRIKNFAFSKADRKIIDQLI
jgi:A/G-specific adenine glycosylase